MKRIHLDTTFLMPFFNLEPSIPKVDIEFMKLLKETNFLFSYSTVSIVEMKWIIIQLTKRGENRDELEKQFSESLGALRNDERFKEITIIDPIINDISYELTKLGHKDYFDTVIGSSALWEADTFITQDKELGEKMNLLLNKKVNSTLTPISIVNWPQFKSMLTNQELFFENKYGKIALISPTNILLLEWLKETKNMTNEDFKEVNLKYAEFAIEKRTSKVIVDTNNFFHTFTESLQTWRVKEIIPRYHKAGVKKFAFVHSPGSKLPPNNGESIEGENYLTKHFHSYENAYDWFNNED